MTIHLKPDLQAVLEAEVAAGRFMSVDEALEAAVLGLTGPIDDDLSWAKPLLAEADRDISSGRTSSHDDVWSRIEKRLSRSSASNTSSSMPGGQTVTCSPSPTFWLTSAAKILLRPSSGASGRGSRI